MTSEIQIQAKIFQHFHNNHPETRGLIFHVPNGGKRSKIESTQLKASGVVAGIPDLLVLRQGRCYGIELKTDIGRVRPEQIKIHEIWESNGVPVHVCRSFEETVKIINCIFGIND